jgi:isoamylase
MGNGKLTAYPGAPYPLGATWTPEQTNFALFSENATGVELCLFDKPGKGAKETRVKITERLYQVWHIALPNIKPGQLYGFRVGGPYDPSQGHRFNSNKLLLDPYAKAVTNTLEWNDALFGYKVGDKNEDLSMSDTDSAPYICLSVVIDDAFDWTGDHRPQVPIHQTVIYETHVKGFTQKHPDLPEDIRGTYKGLAHPVMIQYMKDLGITAVELMPIHHFVKDRHLIEKGLTNYWGYNTINFFAPEPSYSSNESCTGDSCTSVVKEFKETVKALHAAGIEVILDVVYNHTAEGNQMGPTLSFKGIDNKSYYRLADDWRHYKDYTGTGNTLNTELPNALQLIMDSLRYWITEMHVDGFRFDLAVALARQLHETHTLGTFFQIIRQDPVISQVKLIAEPWDIGEGGYMVGKFPGGWLEWNGKYRDCIRDYWRGAESMLGEFALRITGSPDLYEGDFRKPFASVNFITAHDGFTLRDLVSYNDKHNEANGENNKDGDSNNRSWNCGAEGDTNDQAIIKLRARQMRNLLVTLFLSQGIPMLVAGDELGKTQKGNNNAYCQDNDISWIDWQQMDKDLLGFVQSLIGFRKDHPVFCRRRWFQGQPVTGKGLDDICWFQPGGDEMTDEHWQHDFAKSLAVYLNGKGLGRAGLKGEQIVDDSFYLLFNAHHEPVEFTLPSEKYGKRWTREIDTAGCSFKNTASYNPGDKVKTEGRSVVVLMNKIS